MRKTKFEKTKFFSWFFSPSNLDLFSVKKNQICKFGFFLFQKKNKFEFVFFSSEKSKNIGEKKFANLIFLSEKTSKFVGEKNQEKILVFSIFFFTWTDL